jgi:hypothetical protein
MFCRLAGTFLIKNKKVKKNERALSQQVLMLQEACKHNKKLLSEKQLFV